MLVTPLLLQENGSYIFKGKKKQEMFIRVVK